jgi:SAM-dependent methyltransferase
MILNQKSNATKHNRYPQIFKEMKKKIHDPNKILSFGCSTGLECHTLNELYYPNSEITGLDINKDIILQNINNNNNKNIKYFSDINKLNATFDIICVMSVLCSCIQLKPMIEGKYTFKIFIETLESIDKLLNKDGYLCIYNSKYLFTDTTLFKQKYKIIDTKYKETGFIYKYTCDNERIIDPYPYFLFQKITL